MSEQKPKVVRVGLTGGVAAGKSTVSKLLELHGAAIIDHDQLSRDVVAPGTPGLDQIVAHFGADILLDDGSLNRQALGSIVFSDDDARRVLENIVHPAVKQAGRDAEEQARKAGATLIVHDIPLLVETGQQKKFDVVVVVETPREVRIERMVERRGLSREAAEARVAAQASDEERRAAADFVIDGGASLGATALQVATLFNTLTGNTPKLPDLSLDAAEMGAAELGTDD